jgi:ribosome biogenesis GTPase
MESPLQEALVLRLDAKVCHVDLGGERILLPLAGKLFEARSHQKRPLAVGDRVLVRREGDRGAIEALLPRQSQLTRRAASEGAEKAQVVAANITLVLAVAALAEPEFQPELVDGVLAAARRESLPAALVLTKLDRARAGEAAQWSALYRSLGLRVFATSTAPGHRTEPAFAELAALLRENRTVLCGLSGAGKSTLLNTVAGLELRIGSLNHVQQGRHTTAHTELLPLPGGGHVLDTPGVRSFHLFHTGSQETQFLFPEIQALLPRCEYRNCLHLDEPGCAVAAARAAGAIAGSRYASYCGMVTAARAAERGDAGPGARPSRRGRRR